MKMHMPRWPACLVGAGEHKAEVGNRRVVDPQLAAVEPPARRRRGSAVVLDARNVGCRPRPR